MKAIDTFDIAKKAKAAGFNTKQTEFLVQTVNTIEDTHISNLATKNDIKLLQKEINIAMYKAVLAMGVIVALVEKFIN